MGRFHINSCIILDIKNVINNKHALDSIYYLSKNVSMDVFIPKKYISKNDMNRVRNSSIIFFDELMKSSVLKSKDYKYYIFIPFDNLTLVHTHIPQFICLLKEIKINKIEFEYLHYKKKQNLIKGDKIYIDVLNHKNLIERYLKSKIEPELLKINTENFGIFRLEDDCNYNINDILYHFYKNYIYSCKYIDIPIDFLIDNIKKKHNYTYLRIGDGEQFCIQSNKSNTNNSFNKNGCNFSTKGLADSLLNILNDESMVNSNNIFIAWNPSVIRNRYDCYAVFKQEFSNPNMKYLVDNTAMIRKLIDDKVYFKNFIGGLNSKKIILYVGPEYMNNNKNPIKFTSFIEIPKKNCFDHRENIYKNIESILEDDCLIIYSGGLGIKYVIYKIYKNYGTKVTQIDMGSVIDPFFDLWSRGTYKKNMDKIKETICFVGKNKI